MLLRRKISSASSNEDFEVTLQPVHPVSPWAKKRVLVLGLDGAGKSTLLDYLRDDQPPAQLACQQPTPSIKTVDMATIYFTLSIQESKL